MQTKKKRRNEKSLQLDYFLKHPPEKCKSRRTYSCMFGLYSRLLFAVAVFWKMMEKKPLFLTPGNKKRRKFFSTSFYSFSVSLTLSSSFPPDGEVEFGSEIRFACLVIKVAVFSFTFRQGSETERKRRKEKQEKLSMNSIFSLRFFLFETNFLVEKVFKYIYMKSFRGQAAAAALVVHPVQIYLNCSGKPSLYIRREQRPIFFLPRN